MSQILTMKTEHLERVNEIFSKSFSVGRLVEGMRDHEVPLYDNEYLRFLLASCPRGCFVGALEERPVSYLFSRAWGSLGWFGPMGVSPSHQGKGFGKEIIQGGIEFLKGKGVSTIGLEISPRNNNNLGLYLSLGFREAYLVVELQKRISQKGAKAKSSGELSFQEFGKLSQGEQMRFFEAVGTLAGGAFEGLDFRKEIENVYKYGIGEAYLALRGRDPVAFFIFHLKPHFQGEGLEGTLKVRNLITLERKRAGIFRGLISFINRTGRKKGFSSVSFNVPLALWEDCSFYLREGFKVARSSLRMTLENFPEQRGERGVLLAEWKE